MIDLISIAGHPFLIINDLRTSRLDRSAGMMEEYPRSGNSLQLNFLSYIILFEPELFKAGGKDIGERRLSYES